MNGHYVELPNLSNIRGAKVFYSSEGRQWLASPSTRGADGVGRNTCAVWIGAVGAIPSYRESDFAAKSSIVCIQNK